MLIIYMISYEFSKYYLNIMNFLYTFTITQCYTEYSFLPPVWSDNSPAGYAAYIILLFRRIYDDQRNAGSPGCQVPVWRRA